MSPTDNDPISAFIACKASIDGLSQTITAASEDHFGIPPEEVHWGHVGNLNEANALLERAVDLIDGLHASRSSK